MDDSDAPFYLIVGGLALVLGLVGHFEGWWSFWDFLAAVLSEF